MISDIRIMKAENPQCIMLHLDLIFQRIMKPVTMQSNVNFKLWNFVLL